MNSEHWLHRRQVVISLKRWSRQAYRCHVERSEASQIVVLWFGGRIDQRFFSRGCEIRMTISLTTITVLTLLTDHVPSVRGLSPPAIDSRMEVSAWTFFIRT